MSESEEFSRLSPVKGCPICGQALERGYVNAPGGVLWLKRKPKVHFVIICDSRFVVPIPAFHAIDLPALKCGNCKFIAFFGIKQPAGGEPTPKAFLKKCVECGETIPIASEYCLKCGAKQKEKEE